jgi:hypothetical protein
MQHRPRVFASGEKGMDSMRLKMMAIVAALLVVTACQTTQAVDWESFWSNFHLVKQRNNAWPQPFLHQDQQAYFGTINPMIQQGWQIECTLAAQHFDAQTNKLNRAGVTKLKSILATVPADQRRVLVSKDLEEFKNEKRIESVNQYLTNWNAAEGLYVGVTDLRPATATGIYTETNYQLFQSSVPKPTLQAVKVSSTSSP